MTEDDVEVTVVIPTRDRPELLLRAVRSVLAQTFADFEILVVIDGINPATVAALESMKDPRLRWVELQNSVGGGETRNTGARLGKGRWIALLDDDDEWLPEKLVRQLHAVGLSEISVDVLVTSEHIYRHPEAPDVLRPRRLPAVGEPLSEFMFDHLCYFQTSTFLCSRELFLKVPFDASAPFFQDIDWFLRLSQHPGFRLVVVPEPLTIYHVPFDRQTVTQKTGWRSRLNWGISRRSLLSRRAYARFIVGSCAARAVQESAGVRGFLVLAREMVVHGAPTPYMLALLTGIFLISPALRQRLRDLLFLRRGPVASTSITVPGGLG